MKRTSEPNGQRAGALLTLAAAALALTTCTTSAQTWQTVDDFQYAAGKTAENAALTVLPNGALLAAGDGSDAAGVGHALVMSSTDGGLTWGSALDDFTGPVAGDDPYYLAVGSDPAGNLYAAGSYSDVNDPNATAHWLVRRSADAGLTWSTVDDVAPYSGSWPDEVHAIAADAAGNVYLAGYMDMGSGSAWVVRKGAGGTNFTTVDSLPSSGFIGGSGICVHPTAGILVAGQADIVLKGVSVRAWIVRRSTNAGATWATVDTFYGAKATTYYFGRAYAIGADAHGNLYVAGALAIPYKGGAVWQWVVRKSSNGGSSWSTVDTYQLAAGGDSMAQGFVSDAKGNLYVVGFGSAGRVYFGGVTDWIVRSNPGGTGSWSTVDTFQYATGSSSRAAAIAANAAGNVFVGGWGFDSTAGHWLVRRN